MHIYIHCHTHAYVQYQYSCFSRTRTAQLVLAIHFWTGTVTFYRPSDKMASCYAREGPQMDTLICSHHQGLKHPPAQPHTQASTIMNHHQPSFSHSLTIINSTTFTIINRIIKQQPGGQAYRCATATGVLSQVPRDQIEPYFSDRAGGGMRFCMRSSG